MINQQHFLSVFSSLTVLLFNFIFDLTCPFSSFVPSFFFSPCSTGCYVGSAGLFVRLYNSE
jgi:hypothetical protein